MSVAVPAEFIPHRQFVTWRWEERNGKVTKPPYNARTGDYADSTDPQTWSSLNDAVRAVAQYDGLGFVLTEHDPFVGIDLDHCVDAKNGAITPWAKQIVDELASYTEITPSGTGLRIFVRGILPSGGRKRGSVEMYDRARFLTVTGLHLTGTPTTIEERTGALATIHKRIFGGVTSGTNGHAAVPSTPVLLEDAELLERAKRSRNGDRFGRLWTGDVGGFPSHSEADLALCNDLAFWTGRDESRMDRLFRQSGLFRPKWDERHFSGGRTYGQETLAKAIAGCRETYKPRPTATLDCPELAAAKSQVAADGLNLVGLGDLLGERDDAQAWLVENRLPVGGLGMLAGKPKAGKSTLARCLALRISRGEPWLGFTTLPSPVVYLALEEKRSEVREHFRALGATSADPIVLMCESAPIDAIERLRREAERRKPGLIIVDPLFRLIRVDDGNDYASMTAALEPLLILARETGAHVLAVHHLGKGERSDTDAILGSTAIFAAVDTALLLKRSEKYRTLSSVQRYGEDLEEITVTLDPVTRDVVAGPSRDDAELADAGALILQFLATAAAAVTEAELDGAIECRRQIWKRALRDLVGTEKVLRTGRGGKGDPFRYSGSPSISGNQGTRKLFPDPTALPQREDSGSQVPHGVVVPAVPVPDSNTPPGWDEL